jgi:hypothetical protein
MSPLCGGYVDQGNLTFICHCKFVKSLRETQLIHPQILFSIPQGIQHSSYNTNNYPFCKAVKPEFTI